MIKPKTKNSPYIGRMHISRFPLCQDKKSSIGMLVMEITERCNNNCIHCYINLPANDASAKERELSTREIKVIISQASLLGCTTIRFSGGEPLLREDFEKLYLFARKSGKKVHLLTNATLVTPRLAKLFSRVLPLENIEVSIYGMKKESYEAVTRTPGSFEAAFRGINLFLKYKVPFTVRSAVLPPNKTEINAFDKWALTIPRMKKRLPSYSMFLDLHCRGDMHKDKLIKKLRIIPQEGVQILLRRQKGYASSIREFFANFTASPTNRLFTCIVGLAGACVDAYGYLHPCQLMKCPDFAYDLRNGSLQDALTYAFPRLREMRSTNGEYLSRCARCFLKGFCQQCPAKSWNEHGSLDKPVEYFCEVAHTQAEYLGLLQSGEKAWQVNNWQERLNNFLRKDKEG